MTRGLCALLVLAVAAAACAQPAFDREASAPIAGVWRSRCGACHLPVEPGSRPEEVMRAALRRHRGRLRLTESQWSDLGAWLAQR